MKTNSKKFVQVRFLTSLLLAKTEKAQLVKVFRNNEPKEFWLPLNQITLEAEPEKYTKCLMPAWLYYRSGLKESIPHVRWMTEVSPEAPEA